MANNNIELRVQANTRQAVVEIQRLNTQVTTLSRDLRRANENQNRFNDAIKKLTTVSAIVATATATIKSVVTTYADFEESIKKLGAISKATGNDLTLLEKKAKELGSSTRYSATEVSEAMNYLAMAGFSVSDILASTNDVLKLATVGQLDLAKASDISSDVLSGFGLEAKEMGRVVDVMSATITTSNTNVEQLGEAFKNVAAVASSYNLSIEETSTMLGTLADNGRKGGEAGTQLKIILQNLRAPASAGAKALETLGISAYDSTGKAKNLIDVMQEVSLKTKQLDEEARANALKDIFGSEASASALILLNNLDKVDAKLKKVSNSTGQATKISKEMNDTLNADFKELMSALEGLAISIGEDLAPAIREIVQGLTEAVKWVKENKEEIYFYGKVVLESVAAIYALQKALSLASLATASFARARTALALTQMTANTSALSAVVAAIIPKIRAASAALMAFAAANPILAALSVVIGGMTYYINNLKEEIDKLNESTNIQNNLTKEGASIFSELESKIDKNTKSLSLTKEEQIGYLKNIDLIIEKEKSLINKLDENDENNYRVISSSKQRIETLEKAKKKISEAIIVEEKSVEVKEKNTAATKEQNNAFKEAVKRQEEAKQKHKEYVDSLLKDYNRRNESATKTLSSLYNKENSLVNDLKKLEEELHNIRQSYANKREFLIEEFDNKLKEKQNNSLTDYEKYTSLLKSADESYAKYANSLKEGNLEAAKKYIKDYLSAVEGAGVKEISVQKEITKAEQATEQFRKQTLEHGSGKIKLEQLNAYKQEFLDTLSSTSAYEKVKIDEVAVTREEAYRKYEELILKAKNANLLILEEEKNNEINAHNEKIRLKQIELESVRTQILAQKELVELIAEMITLLKGNKVEINTTSAKQAISNLDEQIKSLEQQIAVGADTSPATDNVDSFINKTESMEATVEVGADTTESKNKIKKEIGQFEKQNITASIDADTSNATEKTTKLRDYAGDNIEFTILANAAKANSVVDNLKKPIDTTLTVNIDASRAFKTIRNLQLNTSSTHTVYVKKVTQAATGGLIEPEKYNTGGTVFRRIKNKVLGHDLSGKDDVPALLTRGEFVQNVRAVDYYGADFMRSLNTLQIPKEYIKRFATGGLVLNNKNSSVISSSNISSSSISSDTDSTTGTSTIKEILEALINIIYKRGLPDNLTAPFKKLYSTIKQSIKTQNSSEHEIETIKERNNGKILTQAQQNEYESKLDYLSSQIAENDELIEDAKDTYEIEKAKLDSYLVSVSNIKREIQSSLFGGAISTGVFNGSEIWGSVDLERLEEYLLKIREYAKLQRSLPFISSSWLKNNPLPKFQTGGAVDVTQGGNLKGYGGGDTQLALLEKGEFVIRKEAVRGVGSDVLHRLNNLKFNLPRFKTGGFVGKIPTSKTLNTNREVTVSFLGNAGERMSTYTDEMTEKQLTSFFKRLK